MNFWNPWTRLAALALGLLGVVLYLGFGMGIGFKKLVLLLPSALVAIGGACCFAAFAHSPRTLLQALGDVFRPLGHRKPEDLERSAGVFRTLSELAVPCGWIGYLLGVIWMLRHLADPKAVGMVTRLSLMSLGYGYFFSSMVCFPCRERLQKLATERRVAS